MLEPACGWGVAAETVLVAGECVVAFPLLEGLRRWLGWKRELPAQYRLAWAVGLVVLGINALALLLQQRTGFTLPSPALVIHALWLAVLLYPVFAALTWVGVLDLLQHLRPLPPHRR
jgi:hypothetical protein